MNPAVGLYLSIPFCKAKCSFCNFASDAFGATRMDAYVDRLCEEIREARRTAEALGAQLESVTDSLYFGGGTPSLLSAEQFQRIFSAIRDGFEIAAGAEVTLECAPGQLADKTLEELLRQGTNRISLGVQSFVDHEAQAVGRLHTGAMCEAEIERLRGAGVPKIGLDLIVGLPHQTEASWGESLGRTLASGVTHASVYMLEVDEESRLGREVLSGGGRYGAASVPEEDETAAWYEIGCEILNGDGMRQYEISNFAREGYASRHNMKYWRRLPYMGFGLDAHSMLPAGEDAVRFQNVDDLDVYTGDAAQGPLAIFADKENRPEPEWVGREAAFEESLFLGLRLIEGVDLGSLRERFGQALVAGAMPGLSDAREAGFLTRDGDRIALTARGRLASNEVFSRLLVPATT